MNQTHKKIAEMIKEHTVDGEMNSEPFTKDLADYFEKEEKLRNAWEKSFNRKQFLKDCGV